MAQDKPILLPVEPVVALSNREDSLSMQHTESIASTRRDWILAPNPQPCLMKCWLTAPDQTDIDEATLLAPQSLVIMPPSRGIVTPVVEPAASEARYITAAAMCSIFTPPGRGILS